MRPIVLAAIATLFAAIASAQNGWRLDNPSALWLPRDSHSVTVFNGRLWLLNGYGGPSAGSQKDIWSSADGELWDLEVAETPWGRRNSHAAIAMGGRMWILGGWYFGDKNDVWSSSDGTSWTEETSSAPWSSRSQHAVVVFDNKMWLLGGLNEPNVLFNDIWSSTDGVSWTLEGFAPWSARSGHAAVVHLNRIWVVGGVDWTGFRHDVWSSPDGVNWTQESASAAWHPRAEHTLTVFKDRLWLVGGTFTHLGFSGMNFDDTWSSADASEWNEETSGAAWSGRGYHAAAAFDGRLWILGGPGMNDVWSYGLHASPDDLPVGVVEHPYSASLEAREGDGPFVWALTGGSLPPGLALDTSTTAATLPISGTPSQVGTFSFTIHLTDNNGYTNEQPITIKINPPKPLQSSGSSGSGCALSARLALAAPAGPATLALLATATAWAILRRRKVRSPSRRSRTDRPLADRRQRRDGAGYQIAETAIVLPRWHPVRVPLTAGFRLVGRGGSGRRRG